jgi:hypothetical protein
VLSKHKKWLADLQRTKERLESEYLEEMKKKEDSKRIFQENEKKMRENTIGILRRNDSDSKDSKDSKPETSDMDEKVRLTIERARKESAAAAAAASSASAEAKEKPLFARAGAAKPAWALPAKPAGGDGDDDDEDAFGFQDEAELLRFAESLDFNKYINDIEVATMMEKLRQRISALERDISQEGQEGDRRDGDARAAKREMLARMVYQCLTESHHQSTYSLNCSLTDSLHSLKL